MVEVDEWVGMNSLSSIAGRVRVGSDNHPIELFVSLNAEPNRRSIFEDLLWILRKAFKALKLSYRSFKSSLCTCNVVIEFW